jgi:hypothetical protein
MARQIINVGSAANDGTGSTIRAGGQIINANFSEIYTALGNGSDLNIDTSGATSNQVLKYNSGLGKFVPGSGGGTASFTLAASAGSSQTLSDTDTITIAAGTGITTTAGATDTVTVAIDNTVVTLTGTQTLTNKTLTTPVISTISNTGSLTLPTSTDTLVGRATTDTLTNKTVDLTSNTLSGTTAQFNSALSDGDFATLAGAETLTNKTLTTPIISTISNTGSLTLPTSTDTLVGRSTTDTLTNKTINLSNNTLTGTTAQFNTALSGGDFATLDGTETLTNKTINSTNNTITNINSNNFSDKVLQTSASIDVTASGSSAYLFDSHYSGNNPTLYLRAGHTYALNLNVSGHPFHLQTVSGAYSSGNAYTTGITHISSTGVITTGASALLQVTGTLYIEVPSGSSTSIYYACSNHSSMAGKIVLGPITDTFTGDGSTVAFTINSGRNVNDIMAIVNGMILVPTTDYTISTTTLTFVLAPAASAEIQVRYL